MSEKTLLYIALWLIAGLLTKIKFQKIITPRMSMFDELTAGLFMIAAGPIIPICLLGGFGCIGFDKFMNNTVDPWVNKQIINKLKKIPAKTI